MDQPVVERLGDLVAPLAGSVDRNSKNKNPHPCSNASLPSRGAWIEITRLSIIQMAPRVAPLAGSVDRNRPVSISWGRFASSLPSRGAWIEIGTAGILST